MLWLAGKRKDKTLFLKFLPLVHSQLFASRNDPLAQSSLKMYFFALRTFTERNQVAEIPWGLVEKIITPSLTLFKEKYSESDFLLIASTFSKANTGSESLWKIIANYFEDHLTKSNKNSLNLQESLSLISSLSKMSIRYHFLQKDRCQSLQEELTRNIITSLKSLPMDLLVEFLYLIAKSAIPKKESLNSITMIQECIRIKHLEMNSKHFALIVWSEAKLRCEKTISLNFLQKNPNLFEKMKSSEFIMSVWGLTKIGNLSPNIHALLKDTFLKKNYIFKFDGLAIVGWCFAKLESKDKKLWEKYYKLTQTSLKSRRNIPLKDLGNFSWTLKVNLKNNLGATGKIFSLLEESVIHSILNKKKTKLDEDHGSLSAISLLFSRAKRGFR